MQLIHLRSLAAGLALVALTVAPIAAVQAHEATPGQLHIAVQGTASATPDLAHLSAGVVAEAKTASEAMADQRDRMNRVLAAIRDAGVEDRDIQTSGINLSPIYTRNENRSSAPRIDGYRVTNRVNVTIRDLTKVGAGLDALVAAGANDIGQVSFGFSKQTELVEKARAAAIAELKKRHDFYVEVGGLELGGLVSLSEGGGHRPPQPMMYADRAESMKSSTPVAPGESEVSVSLNAVYQILD
ncbi:SIMPL domain-containing protein [Minwuia sp.]|uniref:SIMPL domain-containing protein n=1 Tax=Minwuia sp. TaxID=2493630 RepID=UPI003A8E6D3E